mgnify:CR=1 FL=1
MRKIVVVEKTIDTEKMRKNNVSVQQQPKTTKQQKMLVTKLHNLQVVHYLVVIG